MIEFKVSLFPKGKNKLFKIEKWDEPYKVSSLAVPEPESDCINAIKHCEKIIQDDIDEKQLEKDTQENAKKTCGGWVKDFITLAINNNKARTYHSTGNRDWQNYTYDEDSITYTIRLGDFLSYLKEKNLCFYQNNGSYWHKANREQYFSFVCNNFLDIVNIGLDLFKDEIKKYDKNWNTNCHNWHTPGHNFSDECKRPATENDYLKSYDIYCEIKIYKKIYE